MKKALCVACVLTFCVLLLGCPTPTTNEPTNLAITLLAIPGITAPVIGVDPVTTAIDTTQYTGSITWSPTSKPFAPSTVYTANIVLTAKTGWTLNGVAANSFTVAGAAATNAVNSGTIAAVFPSTALTITLLAIPGITAPATGVAPVTTAIDTAQYTGTYTWSPATTFFAADTSYRVNIILTAKTGWTFTGVAYNSFTVVGGNNTDTNLQNSGIVSSGFRTTDAGHYTSATIGTLKYVHTGTFSRDGVAGNDSTVSPFRIGWFEITRAQYTTVTGAADPVNEYSSGTSDPVQKVTWFDAVEFCNKLSTKEGLTPVYTISGRTPPTGYPITAATVSVSNWQASGYRLPTEMEWMWAAMGATGGTTGYLKAFAGSTGSNAIGNYAVYGYGTSDTGRTTTERSNPAGSKSPNELGLYDMSGNVWEWNWDLYDASYPTGAASDYLGSSSGTERVFRGGGWYGDASFATIAKRTKRLPSDTDYNVGFRVVRR